MMKKYLAVMFVCLSLISAKGLAYDKQIDNPPHEKSSACQVENSVFIFQKNIEQDESNQCTNSASEQVAQRGCCSHHNGVCGCLSGGRVQCCDGTLSPSCGC
ncbi:MAG: hypothetical protein PHX61_06895 [Alphaproteobacteria bacterium]|nr:hypothetical protein [Alphaproteobacteria bacterium]